MAGPALRSAVVTGIAAMTSIADDIDITWKGLLEGRSGIDTLHYPFLAEYDLPVRIGGHLAADPGAMLPHREKRRLAQVEQLALVLGRALWQRAGSPDVDPERLGVAIGTGLGGADAYVESSDRLRAGGYRRVSPHAVSMIMPNGPAAVVGLELGAKAGVLTRVSASGGEAIANAWQMIALGDADMVVTGGVEGSIAAVPTAAFAMMRAMSTRNDDPARASRPFDADRDGFVLGEAGALLIVESEEHARARGATVHARLLGAGITSDGYHPVAPDHSGAHAGRAITRAVRRADLTPGDITHINAHATGTPLGDLAEARAIHAAIGEHASVYAPKSALGHSIGASGALESALTVLSIEHETVPPTLNYETPDPALGELDIVADRPRHQRIDYAVKNCCGFGGHNVALVFGRY